jgi:hypothetical protein
MQEDSKCLFSEESMCHTLPKCYGREFLVEENQFSKHDERFVGIGFREESFRLPRIHLTFE